MTPNKGDVIERIVRNKIGISELSRKLNVSRTAIYNWFEYGQINLETICKIGQAIDYDFTNDFPEEFANAENLNRNFPSYSKVKADKEDHTGIDYWMNKYITLLEKYNDLLIDINYSNLKANLKHPNQELSDYLNAG